MRYKAILLGVDGLERPRSAFGQDLAPVLEWAELEIAKYPVGKWPTAHVEIVEMKEVVVETVRHTGTITAPK